MTPAVSEAPHLQLRFLCPGSGSEDVQDDSKTIHGRYPPAGREGFLLIPCERGVHEHRIGVRCAKHARQFRHLAGSEQELVVHRS